MEFIRNILRQQIFKFIIVGGFCASLEFITFNIFIDFFKINYLIANVISIVIAVIINYLLSRAFVFEKSRYSKRDEFLSFFLFSLLAIALNQVILWLLYTVIKLDIRLCKALAIAIVAFFNYVTKKYIVFKA
ncbi:Putative flippase GtrA (transmembrane translocase of bactoprenol-linked glucose) [Pedobacter westerhofensis]|uniref:Flippase GtrA (Transmembrane translocase of bactoprenol-linked glucose) n=1 Tax=Pedobacter westerhofensis TaxID=425512 RepID=A0A521E8Q6_9SPHI|nr:GtrA family protein [Pedobacter westerhofensis]SMO79550.1 Putative flippase GtrA (transmembrane translocase of bactoprenol-linked glucose) [Pedobacter westerhofensis]